MPSGAPLLARLNQLNNKLGSLGPEHEAEDDTILGDFPAAGPSTWTGAFGLGLPGTAATFKLFALTGDDNEKGSNPVTLTRPL